MLEELGTDLWRVAYANRLGLMQLDTAMTVAKLPDGGLWVHSPIPLTPELAAEIDALGPVRHLIAPNLFHHMWIKEWSDRYPEAERYGPKSLAKKRPDLRGLLPLPEEVDHPWGDDIMAVPLDGIPAIDEVMFVHHPSATAILTDAVFFVPEPQGVLTKLYIGMCGCREKASPSVLMRMFIKDLDAARASIRKVVSTGPERIALCHNHPVLSDGAAQLAAAWNV